MKKPTKKDAYSVDVVVSMSEKFLEALNKHLGELGERNRSAWIRRAIYNQINSEREIVLDQGEKTLF